MKPPAEGKGRNGARGSVDPARSGRGNAEIAGEVGGEANGATALPDAESAAPLNGLVAEWRWVRRVDRVLGAVAALTLFAMMALTFVNVVMRYFLRQPISGAFEIMTYMMGAMLFVSLVLVAGRSEHVRVGLLDGWVPGWLRQIRIVLFNLVMAGIAGLLGWRLWLFGDRLARWGEKTQMYGLPLDWLAWMMAVCCYASALFFVLTALRGAMRRDFALRAES